MKIQPLILADWLCSQSPVDESRRRSERGDSQAESASTAVCLTLCACVSADLLLISAKDSCPSIIRAKSASSFCVALSASLLHLVVSLLLLQLPLRKQL